MKQIKYIFILYDEDGVSEGFALTEAEAKERGYLTNDEWSGDKHYVKFKR